MTQHEYKKRVAKIEARNKDIEMKQNLKAMKSHRFPQIRKPSTSKLIVLAVFALCLQILWFAEHMAVITSDTTYMYALIAIPAALIPTVISYFIKSKCENSAGGITYDSVMEQLRQQNDSDDEAVG